MELVWIESGTFTMGSPDSDSLAYSVTAQVLGQSNSNSGEKPQHQVTISKGFYLGKFEITQGQWEAVMGTQPWSGSDRFYVQENSKNPAVYISWDDMQVFVHKLNQAAGDSLYRLPTEAEWEYACRAGTTTRWSFGDEESRLKDYAWYRDNAWAVGLKYAQPVGTKLPNPWGLFDMHGNVWESCQDWYANYSSSSRTDPTGPTSGSWRSGCFINYAQDARSARHGHDSIDYYDYSLGARLLRMGPKIGTAVTPQSWGQVKKDSR